MIQTCCGATAATSHTLRKGGNRPDWPDGSLPGLPHPGQAPTPACSQTGPPWMPLAGYSPLP